MSRSQDHVVRLVKALATYDRWTRKELMTAMGWSRDRTERLVKALHGGKAVHIDEWLDDTRGRNTVAVFVLGPGKDAVRRSKLSGSARTKAYKLRLKQRAQADLAAAMSKLTQPLPEDVT